MRCSARAAILLLALCAATTRGGAPYRMLEDMADELDDGGSIVEVGSDRGEGSTHWLSSFASRTHRDFFSVDFAPEGFENARRVCGACAHRGLGEQFLMKTFAEVIMSIGLRRLLPTVCCGSMAAQPDSASQTLSVGEVRRCRDSERFPLHTSITTTGSGRANIRRATRKSSQP